LRAAYAGASNIAWAASVIVMMALALFRMERLEP
jgi:hypothetical protein